MFQLLLGVQRVEVVGGESWLAHNSGSLVLAVAAFLAAYVALRNHRQQLDNDRLLREREHMQDAVDSALESINSVVDRLGDLGACVGTRDNRKLEWAEDEGSSENYLSWQQEASDALVRVAEGLTSMKLDRARLEIRFGFEHPILVSHRQVEAGLKRWKDSLTEGVEKGFDKTLDDLLVGLKDTGSGEALIAFRSECRKWFEGK